MTQTSKTCDVVIVGGGPAGLTAGIYAARARLSTLLIERSLIGGQIVNAEHVENFPAFPDGISGLELGQLMEKQATKFGLIIQNSEVTGIHDGKLKTVVTSEGEFRAKSVILAGGTKRNPLDVPGEKERVGKGVSYCATCDGPFFTGQQVAVVGGGDAALGEALHLTQFASKVYLIHRRREFRATAIVQERVFAEPKIEPVWDSKVLSVEGDEFVKVLRVANVKTGQTTDLDVSGVFVSISSTPDTDYLKTVLELDAAGYIVTNVKTETGVPGIFAAGDVRKDSGRQAIIAAGDGATAAIYAQHYVTGLKG